MLSSPFHDVLTSLRDRIDGTLAVSLIALDGIPIESINDDSVPLDVMGAEFGGFIKSVRLSNTDLNTGDVLQFSLVTEKYITLLSAVTPEYFLLLVMRPDGNYGRARHELSKAKYALRDELV
jgi:predicted regulator of Ras-like GTPase activity (Roadblock/LC7/MglB family)